VLDALLQLPTLRDLAGYDRSLRAQSAAKRATSELTGRFAGAAVTATRARYGNEPLSRYAAELVVPAQIAAECALLKAIAAQFVMGRPPVAERQAQQRQVLTELAEALLGTGPEAFDPALVPSWYSAADDAGRLRVVIDQVAQLTDTSALAWHARLTGPE
jgi:dGTPase